MLQRYFWNFSKILPVLSFYIKLHLLYRIGWHSVKNASCSEDLCHRCLKQYAKLYKGEIESISRYCPLDLFSGDEMRMKNAIFDLFERPHNRFKVFKNGRILYTESAGNPNILQQEIQTWLGPSSRDQIKSFDDGKNIHRLASLLCTALLAPIENNELTTANSTAFSEHNDSVPRKRETKKRNLFIAKKNFDLTPHRFEEPQDMAMVVAQPYESKLQNLKTGKFYTFLYYKKII